LPHNATLHLRDLSPDSSHVDVLSFGKGRFCFFINRLLKIFHRLLRASAALMSGAVN